MTLEEFLELLRKYKEQPKIWTVDPVREMEFTKAFNAIKAMILKEEPDSTIECKVEDGNGVIVIKGSWLTVREVQNFCKALSKANNFEIYPRRDETLCMNIMFHDVYKRAY